MRASGATPRSGKLARRRAMTCGSLKAQKNVHALLVGERRDEAARRVLFTRARQERSGHRVAGLAIERKFEIAREILVPRVYAGRIRQLRQLLREGFVEKLGRTAVVAVADAGIEECIARENRRLIGISEHADVRQRMTGRVETAQLHRAAHADDVAGRKAPVDTADAARGTGMREHLCAGRTDEPGIAAGVIAVLVSIQDLPDLPAPRLRRRKTALPVEWIHREGFPGLGAGDEIVEIAKRVRGPDALDQHMAKVPTKRAPRHNGRGLSGALLEAHLPV